MCRGGEWDAASAECCFSDDREHAGANRGVMIGLMISPVGSSEWMCEIVAFVAERESSGEASR